MIDVSANFIPAYVRIEQDIRGQIESGTLRIGDQIPTEQDLSARYRVARMTVRQGLSRLVADGLLERRRGVGTFVAVPKLEREGHRLLGFEEDARAHGITPTTEVLAQGWVTLMKEDARTLGASRDEKAFMVERLRKADGEPVALNTVLLPPPIGRILAGRDFARSFYALAAEVLGRPVAYAEQRVEAVNADPAQAELLGADGSVALLKIQRVTYLRDGQLLGLTRTLYRGDRYFVALRVER